MTVLRIPCPKCRKSLQLPDRRYLGRRGKCAACGHSFVLQEPEPEIELQPVPEPVADPVEFFGGWPGSDPTAAPVVPGAAAAADSTNLLAELRRKRARRRKAAIGAGALTAALIVGVITLFRTQLSSAPGSARTRPGSSAVSSSDSSSVAAAINASPLSAAVLKSNAALVTGVRPTHGAPIDLTMLPSGVNLVLHLRPSQLWSQAPEFVELRESLTPAVTDWISQQLQATCRRKPEQIDEALIGILLGPTGSTPEIAAVVRLKEPAKLSDLVEELRGEPLRPDGSLRLYRGSEQAYLIRDERTIAICPRALAEDLAEWADAPNHNTTDGILQLLAETDRDRLFTIVFEVEDVRRHAGWLFADNARPTFMHLLDLLGEESETACWSLHLSGDLHSELHVRTRVAGAEDILGPRRLAETLAARITDTPQRLTAGVSAMKPQHSGARQLIGRLPAMVEAVRQSTVVTTGERRVQFTTLLPAKAAPNLALASMLAWGESQRSGSEPATRVVAAATESASLPTTVAERLKLPVDAEFRRTPLRDAFAYICGEIQVKLEIDGDALKDAGYTQNMPQIFNLGTVPADVALSRIVSQYDGDGKDELQMVVVIDEGTQSLHVLTRKFADKKSLTPLALPPAPE
jgi:hypothetical protein